MFNKIDFFDIKNYNNCKKKRKQNRIHPQTPQTIFKNLKKYIIY